MYLKIYKVVNHKRQGYVLLQAVIILMVVVCICTLLSKIVLNNYLKSTAIYTSDDIRTLSNVEAETLSQAEIHFKKDTQPYKRDVKVTGESAKKIIVVISGSNGELIKADWNDNHSHIKLYCEVTGEGSNKVVKLKPSGYRTNYIYQCKCGKML